MNVVDIMNAGGLNHIYVQRPVMFSGAVEDCVSPAESGVTDLSTEYIRQLLGPQLGRFTDLPPVVRLRSAVAGGAATETVASPGTRIAALETASSAVTPPGNNVRPDLRPERAGGATRR